MPLKVQADYQALIAHKVFLVLVITIFIATLITYDEFIGTQRQYLHAIAFFVIFKMNEQSIARKFIHEIVGPRLAAIILLLVAGTVLIEIEYYLTRFANIDSLLAILIPHYFDERPATIEVFGIAYTTVVVIVTTSYKTAAEHRHKGEIKKFFHHKVRLEFQTNRNGQIVNFIGLLPSLVEVKRVTQANHEFVKVGGKTNRTTHVETLAVALVAVEEV